jgi:predicted hotdog family 3-hydroxylacyl-ACP dehydratase
MLDCDWSSDVCSSDLALKLVDTLLDYGTDHLRISLTVHDQPPFGDGQGGVPSYLGLEYLAQAISAFSGLDLYAAGEAPKIGLLIGTRHYRTTVARFHHGELLEVGVRRVMGSDDAIWVFDGEICDTAGRRLADAQIKAYRPQDITAFLQERQHG